MASVTINVERVDVPHAWITIVDDFGNATSYGYRPFTNYAPVGTGDVRTGAEAGNVADLSRPGGYQKTYEISQDQFLQIRDFAENVDADPGTYAFIGNNCTDFVRDALRVGDVPHPLGLGPDPASLIPREERYPADLPSSDPFPPAEDWANDYDDASDAVQPTSPIVLDLDGDGIETTDVALGPYFDHDSNGFAERTGWISRDDGFLARDLNGDGLINNGRELFGNHTLLGNGTASGGYQALNELDGNGDGMINAADSSFSSLVVWRDLNFDGYSDANEIFSLTALNIQSIRTTYLNNNFTDPYGNVHAQVSDFTRTDGSIGATADVWFKTNRRATIAEQVLPLTAEVAALPDVKGSGNVFDLQQAILRDIGGPLHQLIQSFTSEQDTSVRRTLLDEILLTWSGAATVDPASRGPNVDARRLVALETFSGEPFVGVAGPNPNTTAAALLNQSYEKLADYIYAQLILQTHVNDLFRKIGYYWDPAVEQLRPSLEPLATELLQRYSVDPTATGLEFGELVGALIAIDSNGVYDLDQLRVNDEFSWWLDSADLPRLLGTLGNDSIIGTSAAEGLHGQDGDDLLTGNGGPDVFYGAGGNDTINAGYDIDTIYGGDGNDTITDTGGNNSIDAGAGDDSVNVTGYGNDIIDGGDGNDSISVYRSGNHTLRSGAGNDTITVSRSSQSAASYYQNSFTGGLGNDRLNGAASADTYWYNRGDGQDIINDDGTGYATTDTVRFGAGIAASDLVMLRDNNNLVMSVHGSADSITIENWYLGSNYQTEIIRSNDAQVLANTQVDQLIQAMAQFCADNGGITWDQAINQNPAGVEGVLAAYWQPSA